MPSTVSHNEELKSKIHSAIALIRRLREGCPPDEVYQKGILVYDALLDLIELPEITSKSPGEGSSLPLEKLESSAHQIVSKMLFNEHNNPLLSLGLSYSATQDTIRNRWLRLMKIYHPDRYADRAASEEKAKKINEAHRRAIKIREKTDLFDHYARQKPETREETPLGKIKVPEEHKSPFGQLSHVPVVILVSSFLLGFVVVFLIMTSQPSYEPIHKLPAGRATASPERQAPAAAALGPEGQAGEGEKQMMEEINGFIETFATYYRSGKESDFLSLFSENAVKDGQSALDSKPAAADYRMKLVQVKITGKKSADVWAVYDLGGDGGGAKTPAREGRISWSMEKTDTGFKITSLRLQ